MTNLTKKWFQSKTVISGIAAVAIAGYNEAGKQFGLPPIPDFVYGILGVFGIYGRVTANTIIRPGRITQ